MAQEQSEGSEPERRTSQKSYWFVELWHENREIFKELVKHILIFALFLAALTFLKKLLNLSGLPEDRKKVLDTVHFYMFVITLVIFSTIFYH